MSLPLIDVLKFDVFIGSSDPGVGPEVEVYDVEIFDNYFVLLDSSAQVIARVQKPGKEVGDWAGPVLVVAPPHTIFDAYTKVMSALIAEIRLTTERSSAILRALTEAELYGRTLQDIVALLAELINKPVILKDPNHRVLAWSGEQSALDPVRKSTVSTGRVPDGVLDALDNRGILARIRNERRPFRVAGDPSVGLTPRVICPTRAGLTHYGYLSISEGGRRLAPLDMLAVESGAMVVAFHLSRDRAVEEAMGSQRALLLYELLFPPPGHAPRTQRRQASLLGFDIDQVFITLAIRFDHDEAASNDQERWTRRLTSVVATTDAALGRIGVKSAIAMAEDDGILVIVPSEGYDIDEVVTVLLGDIKAHHRLPPVSAGVSHPGAASGGLRFSYEEARLAAKLGRTTAGPGSITHYEDLGALRLLNEVDEDLLERHLSATLGDTSDFREQFFETFGAFVESGFNKAAAARALFIHVNTLKYRLGRIREITGYDPAESHGRFALECTLRLLELQLARANSN